MITRFAWQTTRNHPLGVGSASPVCWIGAGVLPVFIGSMANGWVFLVWIPR